jgi:1-acyl-sn-glycerol-3-phosphate acyltransferase
MKDRRAKVRLGNKFLYWVGKGLLTVIGWKIEGQLPDAPKCVCIGAHHTSTWDVPIFLAAAAVLSDGFVYFKPRWLGKHTIFQSPLGPLARWLGGIPVNRMVGHHIVKTVLQAFKENDEFVFVLAPEGTRKKVSHWKGGFYFIAKAAHVPIVCGFLDYKRKVTGIGPIIMPSGDVEADMAKMRAFYSTIAAKYPDRAGEVRLVQKDLAPLGQ